MPNVEKDHELSATHFACDEQWEKGGPDLKCCACTKHACQDYPKPQPKEWISEFSKKFTTLNQRKATYMTVEWNPDTRPIQALDFISQLLSEQKARILEMIEEVTTEITDPDNELLVDPLSGVLALDELKERIEKI